MCLGSNIRYLRTRKGYSQDYIAEQLGYKSFTTIQKWESGVSEPPLKALKQLAYLLGADMNDMTTKKLYLGEAGESTITTTRIPVLGSVPAGVPIEAIQDIVDYEEIDNTIAANGEYFALRVKGNSMEPRICEGDVLIIHKQDDVESGAIAIIMVNGDDATVKRLFKYADGIRLVPNNPAYEPMFFSNEEIISKPVKVIGKVIENRQKY